MLKIKRETDLGLILMEQLSSLDKGEYLSLQSWAKSKKLPYRFLSKVATGLKKHGLIVSKEGKDGGYRLAKKSAEIKLGQVIKALEGKLAIARCLAGTKCSCTSYCRHRTLMVRLSETLENELNRVSFASLYAGGR